jgi:hypothetical protein
MMVLDFIEVQLSRSDPWNCSTLVADWLIECGYPDYAAEFRRVTDPAECLAVAEARGGLAQLWEVLFAGAVPWADAPWQAGDIAVVGLHGHEAGAIYTGERWALRQAHGLVFGAPEQLSVVRGWRP